MVTRYTTPYHNFILPFKPNEIDKISITYVQNGQELVRRTKEDSDVSIIGISDIIKNASMGVEDYMDFLLSKVRDIDNSSLISIHLKKEETGSFTFHEAEEKNIALIQFQVLNTNGNSFISRPIRIRVYGSITDEVI